MRAAGATYYVGLRHFRHRGLDVAHSHRPNSGAAFVADDVGMVAIDLRDETPATVGSQRFVRYDRRPLSYVICELLIACHDQRFSTARLGRVTQDFLQFGFERHIRGVRGRRSQASRTCSEASAGVERRALTNKLVQPNRAMSELSM